MILILCIACANVTTIESESSAGVSEKSSSDNIDKKTNKDSDKVTVISTTNMSEKQEQGATDSGSSSAKKKGILGVAEDYVKDPATTVEEDFRERWRPKRPATAREIKEIEERAKVRL